MPVLRQLRQPVLALWGAYDVVCPPVESLSRFADALAQGGNPSYTLRVLPDADHAGYQPVDGGFAIRHWIADTGRFADGYIELIAAWVGGLADGPLPSSVDLGPPQATTSTPLAPLPWYGSAMVHLAAVAVIVTGYTAHAMRALIRSIRRRTGAAVPSPSTAARAATALALAGLATVLGWAGYVGALLLSSESLIGPVVLGRSVPWLGLQVFAITTIVGAATAVTVGVRRRAWHDLASILLPLATTVVFVGWALPWGLLLP